MDSTTGQSWSDWLQGVAGTVLDTRLAVYQQQNTPAISVDPYSREYYADGKPSGSGSGISTATLLIGGGALLLVAFMVLKK